MKLASTLLLVLNFGASTASDKQLHLRGGGEEYARRLSLENTTDIPTVSPALTASQAPSNIPGTYEPTVNGTGSAIANTTDIPTVSPAPTASQAPTNIPTVSPAPTASPAPSTYKPTANATLSRGPTASEPTTAPSKKPTFTPTDEPTVGKEPTQGPTKPTLTPSQKPTIAQGPTFNPTLEPCSADVIVPIDYYDNYDWIELPECVQGAGELFDNLASGAMTVQYSDSSRRC
jgi:hypothetical protein